MLSSERFQSYLPAVSASISPIILYVTALSIILTSAQSHNLSSELITSWIAVLFGLAGLLALIFSLYFRQPVAFTGNIFLIIFVGSVGGQISYPELIAASMVAGVIVILVTLLGLTNHLVRLIPVPIVMGLLSGAIFPFVADIFTVLGNDTALIGSTLLAYFLSRRYLSKRISPLIPASVVGILVAIVDGRVTLVNSSLALPTITPITPSFTLEAIVTITPILVVLLTLQANIPSLIFLKSQSYDVPDRHVNVVSGLGTQIGSILGPTGISLSLPITSLVAGESAGQKQYRYIAACLTGVGSILIALLAGVASDLPQIVPLPLLLTLAGLSMVDVLIGALQQMIKGPLLLGPMFAFVIALSEISLLGFGSLFWSLIISIGVTLLLEQDKLKEI